VDAQTYKNYDCFQTCSQLSRRSAIFKIALT
jgi:hypothetical protein